MDRRCFRHEIGVLSWCRLVFLLLFLEHPPRLRQRLRGALGGCCAPAFTFFAFFAFLRRHGAPRAGGAPFARVLQPLPQAQVAAEFAFVVVKLGVRLVGLGLRLQGAVAHVLHAQGGGNHQHFTQRAALARFNQHAAHARVQRQAGQLAAQRGEGLRFIHRAQLGQQGKAVGNGAARGRVEKREVFHPPAFAAQAQRLHAQDDGGQRAAQDFGVGKARAAREVFFVIQAYAHAVAHAPAAARALVGRRLADGLHQQLLHLAAQAVALDARRARVHHVFDAGHRQRGFGHVGRQHDARGRVRGEHAVLLGLAQARKKRQHLRAARERAVRQVLAQVVGRFADFALAGQKHQHIARRLARPEFIDRAGNGVVQAVIAAFFKGPPALLHRIRAARNHQHRRALAAGVGKVAGKALGVNRGGGDDELQIRPPGQDLLEVAQQKVNVQAALVGFVDDERVVSLEQRVGLRFGQQDAVGHQLHARAGREPVAETHLVAHHFAQRRLQLVGNAPGHAGGCDAARLRVANQPPALARLGVQPAAPQRQRHLGQLRGFARTGFAANDDDLMLLQRRLDFRAAGRNGQLRRKGDDGARRS